jgi:hypothetical protein
LDRSSFTFIILVQLDDLCTTICRLRHSCRCLKCGIRTISITLGMGLARESSGCLYRSLDICTLSRPNTQHKNKHEGTNRCGTRRVTESLFWLCTGRIWMEPQPQLQVVPPNFALVNDSRDSRFVSTQSWSSGCFGRQRAVFQAVCFVSHLRTDHW